MRNVTTTLTALFLALGATTFAQPGSLDGTFGTNGKVTTAFATGGQANSVAIQSDGKIIAAGGASGFAVARYNMDGTLDSTFDGDGKVITDFGTGGYGIGYSIAIQQDGRIVVAGSNQQGDFAVVRYNTNGSLDNNFSADGKVTTDFGTDHDRANSVAIQQDGRIVVAGQADSNLIRSDFALARYNTDGTTDNGFGVDGKVITVWGTSSSYGRSVAIQPDGRIVVAGSALNAFNGTHVDFALARYNTDGTLDTTFSGDGMLTTDFGTLSDLGYSVAVQPDGRIVVSGSSSNGINDDFALVRYNTDGTLDTGFGVDGKVITAIGTSADRASSVAIQPDGKIIAAGFAYNGDDQDFALARYHTDGTLDNDFSVDGWVTTSFGGTLIEESRSVAIQPDGKIVAVGCAYNSDLVSEFALARYISGLNVGVVEFSASNNAPLIYPNPIDKQSTLEYTLPVAETISIHLLDMQGRTVQTFIEGQHQAAGEHQQVIDFAEDLPAGSYLIAISSPKGRLTVQVVK